MPRVYQIDVTVNDNGSVETLKRVAQAEDQVVASAQKGAEVIDIFGKRKAALADQATQLRTILQEESKAWDTVTVSEYEADKILSQLYTTTTPLPSRFTQIRGGLNEMASGAGLTVESLGLLQSGFLVAGVAMGSWNIGRKIAELLDLDDKIGRVTATLLGFGNLSGQETAAKLDTLSKASEIAGYRVTDMGRAVEIVTQDMRDQIAALDDHLTAMDRYRISIGVATEKQVDDFIAANREREESDREFRAAQAEGIRIAEANYKREAEAANFTAAEIFGIYELRKARESEITTAINAEASKRAQQINLEIAAQLQIDKAYGVRVTTTDRLTQAAETLRQKLDELNRLEEQGYTVTNRRAEAEREFTQALYEESQAMTVVGHGADDLGGQIDTLAGKTFAFAAGLGATNKELADLYDLANRGAGVGIGDPRSGSGAIGNPTGQGPRVPHFDAGGPVLKDGLIFAHAGEYVLPKDQASRGGGIVIQGPLVDARGANFTNERDMDRLAAKLADKLGAIAGRSLH